MSQSVPAYPAADDFDDGEYDELDTDQLMFSAAGAGGKGAQREMMQRLVVDKEPGQFYNAWGSTFDEGDMARVAPPTAK
jgi:hypothetical protein